MIFATKDGYVSIGDSVRFNSDRSVKTGKVIDMFMDSLKIQVYVEDSTGSYKFLLDPSQIIEILPKENLKKPERYNKRGKLECWDVILDQEMNFLEGNIIKYVWRYKEKNGIEDLKKAKVYLDKLISEVEKK
jgi:hypothetical protein